MPPAIPAVPAGVRLSTPERLSWIYNAPTLVGGRPHNWTYDHLIREPWARFVQIVIGGDDWTFPGGIPTQIVDLQLETPGRWGTALIRFPGFTSYDSLEDELADLALGPDIQWWKVLPDGSRGRLMFDGVIVSPQDSDGGLGRTFECQGIYFADTALRASQPDLGVVDLRDIGDIIGDILDGIPGRRMRACTRTTIGLTDQSRGSQGQKVSDRIAELIAKATKNSGLSNYTIDVDNDRTPIISEVVDPSAVEPDYTFRAGQPGITIEIDKDITTAPNVIYGTGVDPSGCRWFRMKVPRAHATDGKPFPLSSGTISVGTDDADTTSGTGVSDWQRRMNWLGYDVDETGTFSADDSDEAAAAQDDLNMPETGEVDEDLWNAVFIPGDTSDTPAVVRRPLAFWSAVEPQNWDLYGRVVGDNPDFDPTVLRVEDDVDYGEHIKKRKGRKLSKQMIQRDAPAPWIGTATITADPNECHRWDMEPNRVLQIQGLHGAAQNYYMAGLSINFESGEVSAQISRSPINLAAYNAIRERNREARQDPARKYFASLGRRSGQRPDAKTPWLCEDGAGIIPKGTELEPGWNVIRFHGGEYGTIIETVLATIPAMEFAAAVFGKPVTTADLDTLIGDPLDRAEPFDDNWQDLADAGLLRNAAWGQGPDDTGKDQPAGYSPKTKQTGSLTGVLRDDASYTFASSAPPNLWLAIWATEAGVVSGFLRPEYEG